jgi:hypothetical protein
VHSGWEGCSSAWYTCCPKLISFAFVHVDVRGGRDIMRKSPSCSFVLLAIVFW